MIFSQNNYLTKIAILLTVFLLSGCAAAMVENKYRGLHDNENKRYESEMKRIRSDLEAKLADPNTISIFENVNRMIKDCGDNLNCKKATYESFIKSLHSTYSSADFTKLFTMCHNVCKTPRQLEYLAAIDHSVNLKNEIENLKREEEQRHQNILQNLDVEFQQAYRIAKEQDHQTVMAIEAGLLAMGQAMEELAASQQSMGYSSYNYYNTTPSYQSYSQSWNSNSSYTGSGTTYYSGDISGTSNRIGNSTYHYFDSGVSGTSHDIGNSTYHNFSSGLSGSSHQIGNSRYHNFNSGLSGSTQSIGNSDYSYFSDGTHCTTQYIGNTAYTNCY